MISDCRPLATTEDDKTAICQALDNLIDECTLILGWCYSQDHVRTTKVQQRDLSRSALAKMQIYCPDNKNSLHIPEDKFVEKAGLASLPLKPTMIFETSSSAKLVYSTMAFVFLQFLIQFFLWNWNINEWFCYVVHILIFPFLSQFYPCFLCSILWKFVAEMFSVLSSLEFPWVQRVLGKWIVSKNNSKKKGQIRNPVF